MSTIQVSQSHDMDREQARAKLGSFEEMMGKYGVKLEWDGDEAVIKGFGVSGDVRVTDGTVEILLKLSMMAKAAGVDPERLKGSVSRRLAAAFAPAED
jgi:putative polyhydroxyalkanoate system protein